MISSDPQYKVANEYTWYLNALKRGEQIKVPGKNQAYINLEKDKHNKTDLYILPGGKESIYPSNNIIKLHKNIEK